MLRPPWSPEDHSHFPPAFLEAARAFLLAAVWHQRRGGGEASLGALPPALLQRIIGLSL